MTTIQYRENFSNGYIPLKSWMIVPLICSTFLKHVAKVRNG